MPKKQQKPWFLDNLVLLVLLISGTIIWSLTMVKSGIIYDYGMGFWGANGHDGVWHIALAQSLARESLQMPTFVGSQLQNYHIGFDLLLAGINRITSVPVSTLYFQILPPILALLIGFLTYFFVYNWKKSKIQALWSVFFVYFGGSWGWIITILRGEPVGGESMFWSQQAISTLINPPFAMSLIFLLLGLIFLLKLKQRKTKTYYLLTILCFSTLIQIKAYAGILALGGLFMAGVYLYLRSKDFLLLKIFLASLLISIVLFVPLNRQSSGLLVFQPFWFLETMLGLSDRLYWPRFYEAMMNYRLGNNFLKAIPAYTIAFIIFWFGNLGTRIVKEILVIRWILNPKKINWGEVFVACIITAGAAIPTFFLQKGTPWNTIQFIYYSLFFSSVLAGIVMEELLALKKRFTVLIVSALIIFLTVPTTIGSLYHYLPSRPPAKISQAELEALTFLEKQEEGVVLTYPFDGAKAKEAINNPPRPLYLYESTAYVAAYGNKPVFLEDEVNLNIMGYNWKERRNEIEGFYKSNDHQYVRDFLSKNNISYIYWLKGQRALLGETQLGIAKIFENREVDIYKVVQ